MTKQNVNHSVCCQKTEKWKFWHSVDRCVSNTSRRQQRQIALSPLVFALVPLKCPSKNIQFPHSVPFTKENMPRCPCPFKNEATNINRFLLHGSKCFSAMGFVRYIFFTNEIMKLPTLRNSHFYRFLTVFRVFARRNTRKSCVAFAC